MEQFITSFNKLKSYCEKEQFKGWDPYDGLNSKIFQALPFFKNSALCRLIVIQGFKRCPFNLRQIAMVPKEHNAKGIGLFLSGYCNLYNAVKKEPALATTCGSEQEIKDKINEFADKVLNWAIKNMQSKNGYFYYPLKKGISSKISYMIWSNAFMFNAMSHYINN